MTKGMKHGNPTAENAIAELFGAFKERIILFSAETGLGASWVAERISELLSPSRERVLHHLSQLQLQATGNGRSVEPLALAVDAHQHQTQPANVGTTSEATKREIRNQRKNEWYHKNKVKVNAKRRAMEAKEAKRHIKAMERIGKNGKPKLTKEERAAKQKIYQARHMARKLGQSLPDLPPSIT